MRSRIAIGAASIAIVMTACGGSSDDTPVSADAATTTAAPAPSTTAEPATTTTAEAPTTTTTTAPAEPALVDDGETYFIN